MFTAVDLFTNYSWFFPMKNKDALNVLEAFKAMLKYNLKYRKSEHRHQVMQKYDFPKIILSDEGKEFLGEFEAFLKKKGIKQMQSKSYTPQPNIEATNGVLRNLIRAQFIKNKSLIWKDHCDDMMKSKNSNRDKVYLSIVLSIIHDDIDVICFVQHALLIIFPIIFRFKDSI